MYQMFIHAYAFNGDISGWNVGSVTDMQYMFYQAYVFNQDLSSWKTGKVVNMYAMFYQANSFTGASIANWDVSSVTNFGYM